MASALTSVTGMSVLTHDEGTVTQAREIASTMLNRSVPATEFALFPRLPAELRQKIWKLSAPGPRILYLKWNWTKFKYLDKYSGSRITCCGTPVPTILHACRESRSIGLKTYTLGLRTLRKEPTFYVDFSRDMLHFGAVDDERDGDEMGIQDFTLAELVRSLSEEELGKIRYLSFDSDLFDPLYIKLSYEDILEQTALVLPQLSSLVEFVIVDEGDHCRGEAFTGFFADMSPTDSVEYLEVLKEQFESLKEKSKPLIRDRNVDVPLPPIVFKILVE